MKIVHEVILFIPNIIMIWHTEICVKQIFIAVFIAIINSIDNILLWLYGS